MRSDPRQTWLVPLLAIPLSHVALSTCGIPDALASSAPGHDVAGIRREAASIAALARTIAASNGTRGITDEEAWALLRFSYAYVGFGRLALMPAAFLMVGMDLLPGLPAGPLLRRVAEWVGSGALRVPMAAFICTRALSMDRHPPMFVPKIDGYYAQLTRAIDHRLEEQRVETWEDALVLAYRFWSASGWRDLNAWQACAFYQFETRDIYKTERELEDEENQKERRQHRAERKRLQQAAGQAQDELAGSGRSGRRWTGFAPRPSDCGIGRPS
jgi:hypothetical protein